MHKYNINCVFLNKKYTLLNAFHVKLLFYSLYKSPRSFEYLLTLEALLYFDKLYYLFNSLNGVTLDCLDLINTEFSYVLIIQNIK